MLLVVISPQIKCIDGNFLLIKLGIRLTMKEYPTFVTHLECSYTGKVYQADKLHGLSEDGKPLLVKYDLEKLSESVTKESLNTRLPEFWRYREFLPVRKSENIVRLGEICLLYTSPSPRD